MPGFSLPNWFPNQPWLTWALLGGAGAVLLGLVFLLWQRFGPGPRRRRLLQRINSLLVAGEWRPALALAREAHAGRHSRYWAEQFARIEGACLERGAAQLLDEKRYEDALPLLREAAELRQQTAEEAVKSVSEHMLEEVRRLYASSDLAACQQLIARIFLLRPVCPEALFWQALCLLRAGQHEPGQRHLRSLVSEPTEAAARAIDPPLYLGALLLQQGQPKEALRWLTEANRIDGNCPFVTAQLGQAILASGGDTQLAVRALQRALATRGFALWSEQPQRAWVEGFPEGRSFIRRLASKYPYTCPFWGRDLTVIQRQTQLALAQAHERLGQLQEAAHLFNRLAQEGAPSLAVLRGLGMTLARLERFDEAYKHLRAAHELEEPKERQTAGYLALCAARGTPSKADDKANNIGWALWLVGQFTAPGDRDWTQQLSAIHAEARAAGVQVPIESQLHLCEHLRMVSAVDPRAADAYHHLAINAPDQLQSEYAWLYCQAVQQHRLTGPQALTLFVRTFRERAQARAFYEERHWSFDDLEYTFLEAAAQRQPGTFPAILGPDYPPRGEQLLLTRIRAQQQASQFDDALASATVLHKLAPQLPQAHDCLAQIHYRRQELDQALHHLQQWSALVPGDAVPVVRRALVRQHADARAAQADIQHALTMTQGKQRAALAFLGARLLLGSVLAEQPTADWVAVTALLEQCLADDPQHAQALWCLTAVRSLRGDRPAVAALAPALQRDDVGEPRFHYFAALSQLEAQQDEALTAASARAAQDPQLAVEAAYLLALRARERQEPEREEEMLRRVTAVPGSASQAHAQAQLGALRYAKGATEEAIQCWQALPPALRKAWQLDEPLAATVLLSSLELYEQGQYERAAERLREAGKLGCRDRRLGALLALTLFKAGQQKLFAAR